MVSKKKSDKSRFIGSEGVTVKKAPKKSKKEKK